MRDRYTIKAALAIVISIATESMWNCVTCSPLVRLCVTIRLFRHSFSRGQRLIVQRSLGISCVREAAERCSLAERGLSFSFILPLSLVLLQQSLSAVKIVVRRKRGRKGEGSDKQSGDEQEGLARVNHTLLHRRQKTLSRRQLDVLLSIGDTFLASMASIANRFLKFRILSFLGKFIPVTNFFEFSKNNEYNI